MSATLLEPSRTASRPVQRSRRVSAVARRSWDQVGPLIIVAGIWELLAHTPVRADGLLPPFSQVASTAMRLVSQGEILHQLGVSLYRALVGLLLGAVVGLAVGLGIAHLPIMRRIVSPIVTMTYSMPKSALIPIAFLWLGVGNAADILVAFLGAVVPMIVSTHEGARNVPPQLVQSAQSMGAGRVRVLTTVIFPSILPYVVPAFRIALAFSMVVVISAEMVGAFVGIGQYIYNFAQNGNYPQMWAAILVTIAVIFVLDRITAVVSDHVLRWQR